MVKTYTVILAYDDGEGPNMFMEAFESLTRDGALQAARDHFNAESPGLLEYIGDEIVIEGEHDAI